MGTMAHRTMAESVGWTGSVLLPFAKKESIKLPGTKHVYNYIYINTYIYIYVCVYCWLTPQPWTISPFPVGLRMTMWFKLI